MKTPYIKLYTADLLAASRNLTDQQIGQLVVAICEQAFEQSTFYEPKTEREKVCYEMFKNWKEESENYIKMHKKIAKKGGLALARKRKLSDGAVSTSASTASAKCYTETDTDTETDTKTETKTETEKEKVFLKEKKKDFSLPLDPTGAVAGATPVGPREGETARVENAPSAASKTHEQGKMENSNNANCENTFSSAKTVAQSVKLRLFLTEVQRLFEPSVKTEAQQRIWQRHNTRALQEILTFCKEDIPQALCVIGYCKKNWQAKGYLGGYDAVCRHLPQYYAQACKAANDAKQKESLSQEERQAQCRAAREEAYRALVLHARKNGVTPPEKEAFLAYEQGPEQVYAGKPQG